MRPKLTTTIITALLLMAGVSGCLKDVLTRKVSGTYTVSGTEIRFYMTADSVLNFEPHYDTTYLSNVIVDIDREDKNEISVSIADLNISNLHVPFDEDLSSGDEYIFYGIYTDAPRGRLQLKFNKTDWKAIDVTYFQSSGNVHYTDYKLHGRKN